MFVGWTIINRNEESKFYDKVMKKVGDKSMRKYIKVEPIKE